MQLTEAQIQQILTYIAGFVVVLILFLAWFFRSFLPRYMENRQKQQMQQFEEDSKRRQQTFEEELARRRQERQMEQAQQTSLLESFKQVLSTYSQSAQNYVLLTQRMLTQTESFVSELQGNKRVLTDVSATIGQLHAEFQEVRTQIKTIAEDVTSTRASAQKTLDRMDDFGRKLNTFFQQVKEETGQFKPIQMDTLP